MSRTKLFLFALVPVTIIAVISELVATMTIERRVRIEFVAEAGTREYRMRIGRWPWSRRSVTPINSLGFPDVEFPESTTPKACVHVALIGDSFIYGDGVDGDSSFASIVRREARARTAPTCIRFFNLSERGTTIPRQARRVRENLMRLRPDVVILGQYQNDLTDLLEPEPMDLSLRADSARRANASTSSARAARGSGARPDASGEGWGMVQDRLKIFNARIVKMLSYHLFAAMIANDIHRDELRHWSVLADSSRRDDAARLTTQYAASFDSLATELARDGIGFGVVILPSKFDVLAGRFPEEDFFIGLAERHRLPALRIFPVLDAQRSPYPFLMYDGHLNEHGNRLVANAMSEWLFTLRPAPFPVLMGDSTP